MQVCSSLGLGKLQVENAAGTPGDKQSNENGGTSGDKQSNENVYQVYLVFLMACAGRHVPTARIEKKKAAHTDHSKETPMSPLMSLM